MKRNIIRQLYLYAVSIISLFMVVFSVGQVVNQGLKAWVFTLADNPQHCDADGNSYYGASPMAVPMKSPDSKDTTQAVMTPEQKAAAKATCEKNLAEQRASDRQRELVSALSMLIVSLPVFVFHFKLVQKERKDENDSKEEEKKA